MLAQLCRQHPDLGLARPAVIGVSGGRDSVALLHFLVRQGWTNLVVAHFNHGLRGRESGQDAAFVRRLATRLDLACEVRREDVSSQAAASKLSLETAARSRRDVFFQDLCAAHSTRFVFLAHHLEDNAETILGNLCRGSGLLGVSGMDSSSEFAGGLIKVRPLLSVSRQEVDQYVTLEKLPFCEDSSNKSPDHRRNRLRHEVLPLLNDVLLREVPPLLTRFAGLAKRDEACLQELALAFYTDHALLLPDGSLKITPQLLGLHPALRSRILQRWLTSDLSLSRITQREIELAMAIMEPGHPPKVNLPEGVWLRRQKKRLFIENK